MNELVQKAALFFGAFADPTRLEIISLLFQQPLTVNQIHARISHLTLPAISHQLRILKTRNLVDYEKQGRRKLFSLKDDHIAHILNDGLLHVTGTQCSEELSCVEASTLIQEVLL